MSSAPCYTALSGAGTNKTNARVEYWMMARRESDTGIDESAAEAAEATNGTATATARKRTPRATPTTDSEIVRVMVNVPWGLKRQLDTTGEQRNVSTPQLVLNMLADAYAYSLPALPKRARAKKYQNEEERKAQQKAQQAKQRATVKALLAAVERGEIAVDVDALVAKLQEEEAAKAAAKAAADSAQTPELVGATS